MSLMTPEAREIKASPKTAFWIAVLLLLLGWGLRLCALNEVPPGWRDDELINIHVISGKPLTGQFPLYFTDASGHEPLYHYLHAAVHAALGFNVLSGHILSGAFGTLTLALTYALARRLFSGQTVALIATAAMATSFWSLMYSRTGIRHMSLPPFAVAIMWLLPIWHCLCSEGEAVKQPAHRGLSRWGIIGLLTGISLYTYPAARLLPILLIVLAVYLLIFHRRVFMQNWVGMAVAMVLTAVLALPLGVAIAQGTSEAAVEGIGADARLAELAVPIHDLASGNPQTLLQYTWSTLGMFHATGDPEWLYNIPHRPVFNILGGLLFWCSVALSVLRWKQPRFFGLLAWLGLGLAPAFVSVPPASLSHTILILPIVYILPAIIFSELLARAPRIRLPGRVWLYGATAILLGLFLTTNSYRDLHDYFSVWPERGMVRFLYRGEYRDVAQYLNAHPDVREVGVASRLMGPWDRVALDVDLRNQETGIRLFNPERAIVIPAAQTDSAVVLIVPDSLVLHDQLANTVNRATSAAPSATGSFGLFTVGRPNDVGDLLPWSTVAVDQRFANGLALSSWGVSVAAPSVDGGMEDLTLTLYTEWEVWRALELPNVPLIANPPPPGVYSGPRLSVSVHLVTDDGTFVSGDDGLWVDPLTLRPGDRILQVHVLEIPDSLEAGTSIEIGLYDPMTGEQWETLGGDSSADRVLIPIEVDG